MSAEAARWLISAWDGCTPLSLATSTNSKDPFFGIWKLTLWILPIQTRIQCCPHLATSGARNASPTQTLRIYIPHSGNWHKSSQLLICLVVAASGLWSPSTAFYLNNRCNLPGLWCAQNGFTNGFIRAHSTQGVASSNSLSKIPEKVTFCGNLGNVEVWQIFFMAFRGRLYLSWHPWWFGGWRSAMGANLPFG